MHSNVEMFTVKEIGSDFVRFQDSAGRVRKITFADSETRSKEDSASCFRNFLGKEVAIPLGPPFRVWLDLNWKNGDTFNCVEHEFAIANVGEERPF